jgi:hypothetical protein
MLSHITYQSSGISEKEMLKAFVVKLNQENIIEVEWNPSIEEIEKEHLVLLTNIIKDLGHEEKMLVYIDTCNFMSITPEARSYAATKEASEFTLANAVLVDALPKKLLFNFFLKINKPIVPTKGFSSKEEALSWLKSQSL